MDTHYSSGNPLNKNRVFFRASPDHPVVVLLDSHLSHWSVKVLKLAIQHGIHIVL